MKSLIIGLMLVMCLLVPISCTTAGTESEVEEEKPTLTEEQQELWVERGVLPVSTIEEASRLVGYPVATPTFLPTGYLAGDFQLNQLGMPPHLGGEWGDGPRAVERQWTWAHDQKFAFSLHQIPGMTEESVDGEPIEICGRPGKRGFLEAEDGLEHPLVVLHWWNDDMMYSIMGSLADPLTEEILLKIACSVQASGK